MANKKARDMKQSKLNIVFVIIGLIVIVTSQSLFRVDQREQALVLQLGSPVGEPRTPGLHFKIPLIQEVKRFDGRILSVDPAPAQVVIASATINRAKSRQEEQENALQKNTDDKTAETTKDEAPADQSNIQNVSGEPIIVDSFARYKIIDPLQFLKTLATIRVANSRLENILNDATRAVLGKVSLPELLSTERRYIMNDIRSRVNQKIQKDKLGIEIVDVRIVRADLTKELRESTVRRMKSELQERATKTRATGAEFAKKIRATAEKERTVILANAGRDAQILRGEGDKVSIKIYADAFNKDKEFYEFTRSMEAYKNTLANPETRLILSPDSDFFKYFKKNH